MISEIETRIHEGMPGYIEALKQLVRIPSISFDNFDQKFVLDSAEAVKKMFSEAGYSNIQFLLPPSGRPTVYAESLTRPENPTILLYAHHDVQPPMREQLWKSAPFEPETRGDRLYGRGTADDKAGIITHIAACNQVRKALGDREATPQVIRETIIAIREQKLPDPAKVGSAGSFFCNPVISREHFERIVALAKEENGQEYEVPHYDVGDRVKVPAAWMIDQCGFKGATEGGAQVYPKQPLVIVNATGAATPEEIITLERRVIDTIRDKYGIELHPEVEHV